MGNAAAILALLAGLAAAPNAAFAQRAAVPADDFPGLTRCEGGRAVTRIRADVRDSLLQAQAQAHEAVHRAQAEAFPDCESFLGTLTSARRIIHVELPAYCAQWRVAVGQGADPAETRREYAWRIAAQSGAMENRLDVAQRFDRECPLSVSGTRIRHLESLARPGTHTFPTRRSVDGPGHHHSHRRSPGLARARAGRRCGLDRDLLPAPHRQWSAARARSGAGGGRLVGNPAGSAGGRPPVREHGHWTSLLVALPIGFGIAALAEIWAARRRGA